LVLVVCGDLGLAKGTVAVECARATLECYKRAQSEVPGVLTVWEREGQAKVTLKCTGAEMAQLWQQAENAGLVASNNEKMVLGIGPGPISLINTVSGHLKL
ncbi:peptidyl-tRNA hydrolase II domain-containing protein, partial [Coemansia spiralis]